MTYYTILIHKVPPEFATEFHPQHTEVITRGSFLTEREAIIWAKRNLKGTPYTVKIVSDF
jgi:hypothetical protein